MHEFRIENYAFKKRVCPVSFCEQIGKMHQFVASSILTAVDM